MIHGTLQTRDEPSETFIQILSQNVVVIHGKLSCKKLKRQQFKEQSELDAMRCDAMRCDAMRCRLAHDFQITVSTFRKPKQVDDHESASNVIVSYRRNGAGKNDTYATVGHEEIRREGSVSCHLGTLRGRLNPPYSVVW
ncbi:hypothetical protein ABH922_005364 [Rhodococcus sp. 27YEA15]